MDAYPEAKIVLVERKQEAWYRSFTTVMLDVHFAWPCLFFVEYLEWAVPNKNLGVMHLGFLDFFQAKDGDEVKRRAMGDCKE